MRYFFIYFFVLVVAFKELSASAVVFVQGSCRSGKSSLCSAIKKHEAWGSVGSVYFPFSFEEFENTFPLAFSCIRKGIDKNNLRHAITKNIFIFREGITELEKKDIKDAAVKIRNYYKDPQKYIEHKQAFSIYSLREIEQLISDKQNVLADVSWYVSQEQIECIKPLPKTFSVLVYCPFQEIFERLIGTNNRALKAGNVMNYRFFCEPIYSFSALYELSDKKDGAIDQLDKSLFLSIAEMIQPLLPEKRDPEFVKDFMLSEMTQEEFKKYCNQVISQFGNRERLYVIPKIDYDLLVRSSKKNPDQCAGEIVDFVKEFNRDSF